MSVDLSQLGLDRLSVSERLELIGVIWDSIDTTGSGYTPPAWHLDEIQRRVEAANQNPGESISLDELKARVAAKP